MYVAEGERSTGGTANSTDALLSGPLHPCAHTDEGTPALHPGGRVALTAAHHPAEGDGVVSGYFAG